MLFNVAMIGLARRLGETGGIQQETYADDTTIWTNTGTHCEKEEKLKKVAPCVENYVKQR